MGANHGLLSVIVSSVILVAAVGLALNHYKGVNSIAGSTGKALETLGVGARGQA